MFVNLSPTGSWGQGRALGSSRAEFGRFGGRGSGHLTPNRARVGQAAESSSHCKNKLSKEEVGAGEGLPSLLPQCKSCPVSPPWSSPKPRLADHGSGGFVDFPDNLGHVAAIRAGTGQSQEQREPGNAALPAREQSPGEGIA